MNESIPTFRMKNGNIVTSYKPRYVETGKKADYSGSYAKKAIDSTLQDMKREIADSTAGSRSQVGYGKDAINISQKSDFPTYMRQAGISSKKDFMKVLSQKKGARKERLEKIAIQRLNEGYKNKHGYDEPDMKFRQKTGQVYDNKDIIFRRIRGRIVPIRVKKKDRYDLMEDAPF
jgi:hypothetical protein